MYSVFRYSPPSVGFAQLSETALAMNGLHGPPPSPTVGVAAATVSAKAQGRSEHVVSSALDNVASALGATTATLVISLLAACF